MALERDSQGRKYERVQVTGSSDAQAQTLTAGTGLSVSGYAYGVIDQTLGWGTVHFEASYDGGATYRRVPVTNVQTGTKFTRVDKRGSYAIDLRGASHLKYVEDTILGGTGSHGATVTLVGIGSQPPVVAQAWDGIRYAPSRGITAQLTATVSGRTIDDVELSTGTMYAHAGPNISKSTDKGATWTNVISSGQPWGTNSLNGGRVMKLPSGKVLVVLYSDGSGNSKIYLSDASEANFAEVYSIAQQGVVSRGFGLSVWGDVIIWAPYKVPRASTDTLEVHASFDGGANWAVIYTVPATTSLHVHDAVWDPYAQRIWITEGDQYALANVRYSDDQGSTWTALWTDGDATAQFTACLPLPNCVLFGTDMGTYAGVWRLLRGDQNANDADPVFEPAFATVPAGTGHGATYRGKQFWEAGAAYLVTQDEQWIIGTKDGHTFYVVGAALDTANNSLLTVFGSDTNGVFYAGGGYASGAEGQLVDSDGITWSQI